MLESIITTEKDTPIPSPLIAVELVASAEQQPSKSTSTGFSFIRPFVSIVSLDFFSSIT